MIIFRQAPACKYVICIPRITSTCVSSCRKNPRVGGCTLNIGAIKYYTRASLSSNSCIVDHANHKVAQMPKIRSTAYSLLVCSYICPSLHRNSEVGWNARPCVKICRIIENRGRTQFKRGSLRCSFLKRYRGY